MRNIFHQFEKTFIKVNKTMFFFESESPTLIIAINFISSKDIDKKFVIHSNIGNIETMSHDKAGKVFEELFKNFFVDVKLGCKHQ